MMAEVTIHRHARKSLRPKLRVTSWRDGNKLARMKITEYKTAQGRTVAELDAAVNRLLSEAYQPYSGPYALPAVDREGSATICQAMMKVSELVQQKPKLESA